MNFYAGDEAPNYNPARCSKETKGVADAAPLFSWIVWMNMKAPLPIVIIYVYGHYDETRRLGSYSSWIKFQGRFQRKSEKLSQKVMDKKSADFLGIFSTINFAINFYDLPRQTRILIYSEEIDAILQVRKAYDSKEANDFSILRREMKKKDIILFFIKLDHISDLYKAECVKAARDELSNETNNSIVSLDF